MTPKHIALVQTSFADIIPIADAAASLFYTQLFTLDPALRALFPSDMREQRRKLMSTLTVVVRGLHRLENLVLTIQQLGEQHQSYGVQDAHYATVGEALRWTLAQSLGERFTSEVQAAWMAAYTLIAETMCPGSMQQESQRNTVLPLAS